MVLYDSLLSAPPFVDDERSIRVRIKPTFQLTDAGLTSFSLTDFCNPPLLFMAKDLKTANFRTVTPDVPKDPTNTEQERWMHMINYTLLQQIIALKRHNHPLTLCYNFSEDPQTIPYLIGPSVINAAGQLFVCDGCGIDTRYSEGTCPTLDS